MYSSLTWLPFLPAPLHDPIVKKVELTFNAVTLSWDSYPTNESQPGFVRGYHVYVSPVQEDCGLKGSRKHVLPGNWAVEFRKLCCWYRWKTSWLLLILQPLGKFTLGGQIGLLGNMWVSTPAAFDFSLMFEVLMGRNGSWLYMDLYPLSCCLYLILTPVWVQRRVLTVEVIKFLPLVVWVLTEFWKHLFVVSSVKSHRKHVGFTRIWGILETHGIQMISFRIRRVCKSPI